MRTIYTFTEGRTVVGGSGKPYTSMCRKPREYAGFLVELWVDSNDPDDGGRGGRDDSFDIHGDGVVVRKMLKQMLSIVDSTEKYARRRVAEEAAREVQCPACQTYVDPFSAWHADGRGNRCAVKHTATIEAPPVKETT